MLMTGADGLQQFCRSTRSLCTDMGSERLLARMPIQVLVSFMQHVGSKTFISIDSPYIFPHAIHMPGWKHTMDLMTRKGLYMLPWFPSFIKGVKAVVKWVREDCETICATMQELKLPGLAAILQKEAMSFCCTLAVVNP